jgi:hypothetical protein
VKVGFQGEFTVVSGKSFVGGSRRRGAEGQCKKPLQTILHQNLCISVSKSMCLCRLYIYRATFTPYLLYLS